MATRNRLTDLGIANVKKAHKALLIKVPNGWQVRLQRAAKKTLLKDKYDNPVTYSAKGSASRSLLRHNGKIIVKVKAEL